MTATLQYVRPNLDVDYLIKCLTAISSEIEEDKLIDRIMRVVTEASGAVHGYLIVKEGRNLIVRAEKHVGEDNLIKSISQKLDDKLDVCQAIARYVNRTKEAVVLQNASQNGMFKDIPEVQSMKLKSIMCLPIMKQSQIIGMLYLENRLAQDIFTPDKVEMTKMLTYQAAISYENVRLVQRIKEEEKAKSELAKEKTREEMYRRLQEVEETQRATLNILEDFDFEKSKLEEFKSAQFNILEDMYGERAKLDRAQSALLNILDDAEGERIKLDNVQTALINILDDGEMERGKLDETQRALLNMLEDVEVERSQADQSRVLLESVNKELESFSYSVSHDLRAPLRAVKGFAEAVLEDYAPKLDEDGKKYLSLIEENANNMKELIDDLLTFSRLGRREIIKTDVDLKVLSKEVFAKIASAEPKRSVEFKINRIASTIGDESMIRQVLINLFSNALKFSRRRKRTLIEFGYQPQKDAYYVQDNGVGFDMRYKDKLFGVFQRLHAITEFEGTGVGLALVHRIITRHGGNIWAKSQVGKGATFFFTLPRN